MGFLSNIFCGMVTSFSSHIACFMEKGLLAMGIKSLEYHLKRLYLWFAMVTFCVGLLLMGVAFILWGAFALLALATGYGLSALIVGAVVSLIAAVLVIQIKNSVPRQ